MVPEPSDQRRINRAWFRLWRGKCEAESSNGYRSELLFPPGVDTDVCSPDPCCHLDGRYPEDRANI